MARWIKPIIKTTKSNRRKLRKQVYGSLLLVVLVAVVVGWALFVGGK